MPLSTRSTILKFLPGISSVSEKKKFLLFHACSICLCIIIVMIIMLITSSGDPYINPYDAGIGKWIICSIFLWNFIGTWRFISDFHGTDGFLFSRLIAITLIIGFPFFYLYILA